MAHEFAHLQTMDSCTTGDKSHLTETSPYFKKIDEILEGEFVDVKKDCQESWENKKANSKKKLKTEVGYCPLIISRLRKKSKSTPNPIQIRNKQGYAFRVHCGDC